MSKRFLSQIGKKIRVLLLTAALIMTAGAAPLAATTNVFAADATYSCGSYGAGAYSSNVSCNGTVGAPNTGFAAKLMQPSNLIPIVISSLLLAGGVALIIRSSKKRKKAVAFSTHDK